MEERDRSQGGNDIPEMKEEDWLYFRISFSVLDVSFFLLWIN